MKKCPNCGVENPDDAKICRECDALLNEETKDAETVEQPKVEVVEKKEQEEKVTKANTDCYPVTDEELVSFKNCFRFFIIAPAVFLTIMLFSFFIAGLFLAIAISMEYLLIWLGGPVVAVLGYFILKVCFSYHILSIYYASKNNIDINSLKEEISKLKENK